MNRERLRYWLRRRKLTQRELASRAGISETLLSKLLNPTQNRDPSLQTVRAIAKALEVRAGSLVAD